MGRVKVIWIWAFDDLEERTHQGKGADYAITT